MSQFWIGNTSSSSFQPNTTVNIFDDFLSNSSSDNGYLNWLEGETNAFISEGGSSTHPGLIAISSGLSVNISLFLGDSSFIDFPIVLGGGSYSINWVTSLVTLSEVANRYTNQQGMMDGVEVATTNGVYFSYSDNVNGGKWLLNCTNGGITTTVDSGTLAITGFVNLGFVVSANGGSVSFTINGASVGTAITTNIPTLNIGPMYKMLSTSGTLPQSQVDLFYMTYTLNSAR
jgi:hypothetical protein